MVATTSKRIGLNITRSMIKTWWQKQLKMVVLEWVKKHIFHKNLLSKTCCMVQKLQLLTIILSYVMIWKTCFAISPTKKTCQGSSQTKLFKRCGGLQSGMKVKSSIKYWLNRILSWDRNFKICLIKFLHVDFLLFHDYPIILILNKNKNIF